ncbi:flagellar basal body-associated FliL family protein [Lacimonas salitolerans]|uniref:Flagellar protein FliL n=1 Tax=Lacimonas salitolerans TaxID=1323750 RepID=A0ABW4EJB2_9RHOB
MGKILPILLVLVGVGGGVGAGLALRPDTSEQASLPDCKPVETAQITPGSTPVQPEYVKLNNQFVVPVVDRERVASMVVLSLSLEARAGSSDAVFAREPKLRDVFLQVLFDHANVGGFRGAFTTSGNMDSLRQALLDAAQGVMGGDVTNVLITDIARQDV